MERRAFLPLATPIHPDIAAIRAFWARQAETPSSFLARVAQDKGLSFKPPQARSSPLETSKDLKPLNIQAGLEAYTEPLDRRRAAHLLRRTGFGADAEAVNGLIGMTAEDAVDAIVDAALAKPMPAPPTWINEGYPRDPDQAAAYMEMNQQWLVEFISGLMRQLFNGGLQERLTLFWHNHFVTEIDAYFFLAVYASRYVDTLGMHALGNFKDFVHAMGIDGAMLIYLNGIQNQAGAPNENYARELLELFTMGQFDGQGNENYTQQDIEEIARALTGWIVDPFNLNIQLVTLYYDGGQKTIMGRTGAWGYDDVVDILFEERPYQIGAFIARKLYKEFVYAVPNEAFVAELAQVFVDHHFEIAPVMRALLKSAHFHDEQTIGAQIKSPVLMLPGMLREMHVEEPSDQLLLFLFLLAAEMEQYLLNPPNVAGWPGHHTWITTSTLPTRWFRSRDLIFGGRNGMPIDLLPVSETLLNSLDEPVDPGDPASVFKLSLALAEHLMSVPLETLELNAPPDFAGDLAGNPIPDDVLNGPAYALELAKLFLGNVPWYEWSLYRPEAPLLLAFYANNLVQLPEFQLT